MGDDDDRQPPPGPGLAQSLQARDAHDGVLDSVITDYQALHESYRTERKAAIQLRHDLDGLRQRPSLTTNVEVESEENRDWQKSVERSLLSLQEELAKAYSVIKERDRALAASHKQQQDDEDHNAKLLKEVEALGNKLADAQDKIKQLTDDNQRLRQGESRESLQERCQKLEKENQLMLARMKELSDQRSEAMNEMNEIVQKTKSLLSVKKEMDESAEQSCTILDPEAWAEIFKVSVDQDILLSENRPRPANTVSE